jgi:hypothetical protein
VEVLGSSGFHHQKLPVKNTSITVNFPSMARESFILYKSFYLPIKGLSIEEKGTILDAIFQYHIDGKICELSPVCQMAFNFMRSQFERDDEKYQIVVERNRANGAKGGRSKTNPDAPKEPSGFIGNPENPDTPDTDTVIVTENKEGKKKRKTFSPPSLDEFVKYFEDNGYSTEAAKRAFTGYEVADWYDSKGKPVISWKQKCQHVWFKTENKIKKSESLTLAKGLKR